jgi:hypothetical protein
MKGDRVEVVVALVEHPASEARKPGSAADAA